MKKIFAAILMVFAINVFAGEMEQPKFSVKPSSAKAKGMTKAQVTTPAYCEVEVANLSSQTAIVDIYYDDAPGFRNNYVQPGFSLYVDLFYNGYCHNRSYLVVSNINNYLMYSAYAYTYDVINIYNTFQNIMEAK